MRMLTSLSHCHLPKTEIASSFYPCIYRELLFDEPFFIPSTIFTTP